MLYVCVRVCSVCAVCVCVLLCFSVLCMMYVLCVLCVVCYVCVCCAYECVSVSVLCVLMAGALMQPGQLLL